MILFDVFPLRSRVSRVKRFGPWPVVCFFTIYYNIVLTLFFFNPAQLQWHVVLLCSHYREEEYYIVENGDWCSA